MLKGLEVSVLNSNVYLKDNFDYRLDAEYFSKENLDLLKKIERNEYAVIGDFAYVTDGIHTSIDYCENSNVNLFSATTPRENYFDLSRQVFISEHAHALNPRTALQNNDIIISTVGTIGNCAVVDESVLPANSDRHVGIVRLLNQDFLPRYVSTFLLTKFGKFQTWRESTGNVQLNLFLYRIRTLKIAKLSNDFQCEIERLVVGANQNIENSKSIYTQAETLLLETLGMADFTPSSEAVNIKSFKDSFVASGRLDAEYYQPKYEEVVAHIKAQAYQHLIDLVDIQKSVEPGSDVYCEDGEAGLPFLRVADYSKQGLTPPQKQLKSSYVSENWDKLNALKPRKNTILFSKDGSVGEAYCLTEDLEAVTSGAVLHLSVKNTDVLLPEYLTLALNSKLVKMQSERDAGGSIILHWRVSEIENVVVPLVDMTIQRQIDALVQQSFALKAHSTHLLDVAKRAVEIAIEQDEAAAMAFIECEVNDDNE